MGLDLLSNCIKWDEYLQDTDRLDSGSWLVPGVGPDTLPELVVYDFVECFMTLSVHLADPEIEAIRPLICAISVGDHDLQLGVHLIQLKMTNDLLPSAKPIDIENLDNNDNIIKALAPSSIRSALAWFDTIPAAKLHERIAVAWEQSKLDSESRVWLTNSDEFGDFLNYWETQFRLALDQGFGMMFCLW